MIPNSRLWWPNGAGEQSLYDVTVTLNTERGGFDKKSVRAGIRTVQVCHDELDGGECEFYVRINGKRLFCKGFNWIPSDAIYGRTSAALRAKLLEAARDAGGNAYEPDDFYEACDRLGLMVFQEFSFACAGYPDNLEWFRNESENEAIYQVRRPAQSSLCRDMERKRRMHKPSYKL